MRKTMLVAVAAGSIWAQEPFYVPLDDIRQKLTQLEDKAWAPDKLKVPLDEVRQNLAQLQSKLATSPFLYIKGPTVAFPDMLFQQRDRATEQAEREYDRGTRALDKRQWDEAVQRFNEVVGLGKTRVDGALYWKAYALARLGRGTEASATLDELSKSHTQSRWLNDAKILSVEIRQAAGKPVSPEEESDNDIKLMAINALMQSDPERSIPLLEQLLQTKTSPKLRERALFVLSQSESPKAREIVARVAKGEFNPDLQLRAVNSLGVYGGTRNRQLLSEIYASTSDVAVKRQILHSFMIAGDKDTVLKAAKGEANPDLRRHAIHLLGTMNAGPQLNELYASESSVENKAQIMHAMFVSGNSARLIELAKTEKDPKLRLRAIQLLGTMKSTETADALTSIYSSSPEPEVRARVLQALFVQGNAKQLIEIARKEADPNLKRTAVQHLSHMKSKEATDYMMELLK